MNFALNNFSSEEVTNLKIIHDYLEFRNKIQLIDVMKYTVSPWFCKPNDEKLFL